MMAPIFGAPVSLADKMAPVTTGGPSDGRGAARAIRAASLALQADAPDLRLSAAEIDILLQEYAEHDEIEALREEVEQLKLALASRATIEQAKGILMGAERCSADTAFEILKRASQRENVKLRDIAARIVDQAAGEDTARRDSGH